MPPKASSQAGPLCFALPVDTFLELRAFQDQLLSAAWTLDPATSPCPSSRKPEQARHRALASVFRTWADQVDRSLGTVRSP
ncbi:XAC0095 family protein [Pseudomonas sp. CGJS7]|uniref:XAC0095 family protein n=1 Tax=Pseudomonas sp. CGJS7 TaxID=3109348 RepID=UPI00300926D0